MALLFYNFRVATRCLDDEETLDDKHSCDPRTSNLEIPRKWLFRCLSQTGLRTCLSKDGETPFDLEFTVDKSSTIGRLRMFRLLSEVSHREWLSQFFRVTCSSTTEKTTWDVTKQLFCHLPFLGCQPNYNLKSAFYDCKRRATTVATGVANEAAAGVPVQVWHLDIVRYILKSCFLLFPPCFVKH